MAELDYMGLLLCTCCRKPKTFHLIPQRQHKEIHHLLQKLRLNEGCVMDGGQVQTHGALTKKDRHKDRQTDRQTQTHKKQIRADKRSSESIKILTGQSILSSIIYDHNNRPYKNKQLCFDLKKHNSTETQHFVFNFHANTILFLKESGLCP